MTRDGVRRLISYERVFYPKARRAADYSAKGVTALEDAYMDAFSEAEDEQVLNTYLKMVKRNAPFPSVGKILEAAGVGYITVSGADIEAMSSGRAMPTWRAVMMADMQDGREVRPESYYIERYGR